MFRSSRRRVVTLVVLLVLLSFAIACQRQTAADTRAADEATLRNLDAEWSKAVGAKDLEKTVSYYTDDALVMAPNIPVLKGKEQASGMWKAMFSVPGLAVVGPRPRSKSRVPATLVG